LSFFSANFAKSLRCQTFESKLSTILIERLQAKFLSLLNPKKISRKFIVQITRRTRQFRSNVPPLGEVANFVTVYFPLKIKFLAERKREFTKKFAILPNGCYRLALVGFQIYSKLSSQFCIILTDNSVNIS
jgi:hypothetical protein